MHRSPSLLPGSEVPAVENVDPDRLARPAGRLAVKPHSQPDSDSLGGVVAWLDAGHDPLGVQAAERLVANRGRRLAGDAAAPCAGVEPPADLDRGFFNAGNERAEVAEGGEAEEAAAGMAEYRPPAEAVVIPVPQACLVPLVGVPRVPRLAVADVPRDALVGGQPGEVVLEGILPGHEHQPGSSQGLHAAEGRRLAAAPPAPGSGAMSSGWAARLPC